MITMRGGWEVCSPRAFRRERAMADLPMPTGRAVFQFLVPVFVPIDATGVAILARLLETDPALRLPGREAA